MHKKRRNKKRGFWYLFHRLDDKISSLDFMIKFPWYRYFASKYSNKVEILYSSNLTEKEWDQMTSRQFLYEEYKCRTTKVKGLPHKEGQPLWVETLCLYGRRSRVVEYYIATDY